MRARQIAKDERQRRFIVLRVVLLFWLVATLMARMRKWCCHTQTYKCSPCTVHKIRTVDVLGRTNAHQHGDAPDSPMQPGPLLRRWWRCRCQPANPTRVERVLACLRGCLHIRRVCIAACTQACVTCTRSADQERPNKQCCTAGAHLVRASCAHPAGAIG